MDELETKKQIMLEEGICAMFDAEMMWVCTATVFLHVHTGTVGECAAVLGQGEAAAI